ncbi:MULTISPECIES: TIGR03643 family protein [Spirosoma]|uniref:TIGR03643 family protein n=1 Tax=Spirosoma liriopis TaxID=2937440 RepID=A0ABT0HN26_9BACT|nr:MULTISPECIES: TIGR03643 family protein [Spirosoma]MCK8493575.1 TIGR03643 family protein [Spirosoma liriopis]UHG92985.1 TIGR03643 family protein [Spirosoma oryzicola]
MKTQFPTHSLSQDELDRLIEMAWEDRTPFEAIQVQFGLPESAVIQLLRKHLKPASWRRWRARVQGRSTKHAALSSGVGDRFKSAQQRLISQNRISKR